MENLCRFVTCTLELATSIEDYILLKYSFVSETKEAEFKGYFDS